MSAEPQMFIGRLVRRVGRGIGRIARRAAPILGRIARRALRG